MAIRLDPNGIFTNETIEASQVSQSIDALTGTNAYDINISGSFEVTGSFEVSGSAGSNIKFPSIATNITAVEYGQVLIDPDGILYSGSAAKGEKGQKGAQGETGEKGQKGEIGPKGQKGQIGTQGPIGIQGPIGLQGVQGTQGTQGIQGTQGLTGPKGQKGEIGPKGQKGEIGVQGIQGTQGTQGTQGETGEKGQKGEIGVQGIQGTQGTQGTQGETGEKGQKGEIGAQGIQGTQGETGEKGQKGQFGVKGVIGPKGQKGEIGVQGIQGTQGTQGTQGETGEKGQKGEIGVQGTEGTDGETPIAQNFTVTVSNPGSGNRYYINGVLQDTLTLFKGFTYTFNQSDSSNGTHPLLLSATNDGTHGGGSQYTSGWSDNGGTAGTDLISTFKVPQNAPNPLYYYCVNHSGMGGSIVVGVAGTKGETGEKGIKGEIGPKGQKGEIGPKGQKGEVGEKGQKGEIGLQGLTGVKGQKGEVGATGLQGTTGTQGTTGEKGIKGEIGNQGTTGIQGTTGEKGQKGELGLQGTTGAGTQGTTGTQGTQGTSGEGATIANDAATRVTTAVGDGTLNAEEFLTFDGTNLIVTGSIALSGSFKDQESSTGTLGQVLSSTATGSQWIDAGGVGFPFTGDAVITGSLLVSSSFVDFTTSTGVSGSFSGSFVGNGSGLTGVNVGTLTTITASFANTESVTVFHNFDSKNVAVYVYDTGSVYLIPSAITLIDNDNAKVDFSTPTSGYAVVTLGGQILTGSVFVPQVSTVADTFTSVTSYTVIHNFDTKNVIVSVYEGDDVIFPSSISTPTNDTVELTFPEVTTGRVVVVKAGHIVSGSIPFANIIDTATSNATFLSVTSSFQGNLEGTASYATTASYAENAGGGGGFPFSGSAEITGSFLVSGSFVDFTDSTGVSGSFSGSFAGNGAELTGLGYGDTKQLDQVTPATTWSFAHNMNEQYPVVTVYSSSNEIIQPTKILGVSVNILEIYFNSATAGTAVAVVGGTATTIEAGYNRIFTQSSPATTWSFDHNLGNRYPQLSLFDVTGDSIIPGRVQTVDTNNLNIYFDIAQAGTAAATVGGTSLTASYANSLEVNGTLLSTQENTDVDIGTETIATISTLYYSGTFFDYVLNDGTNYRSGTIMSIWDGSSVQFNDNSTLDIGDTSGVVLSVDISGTDARLRATVTTDNWNIKTFIRAL